MYSGTVAFTQFAQLHCVYLKNNHGTRVSCIGMGTSNNGYSGIRRTWKYGKRHQINLQNLPWHHTVQWAAQHLTMENLGVELWCKTMQMEGESFNHVMKVVIVWFSIWKHTAPHCSPHAWQMISVTLWGHMLTTYTADCLSHTQTACVYALIMICFWTLLNLGDEPISSICAVCHWMC